jgi:hypothetical protein
MPQNVEFIGNRQLSTTRSISPLPLFSTSYFYLFVIQLPILHSFYFTFIDRDASEYPMVFLGQQINYDSMPL